MDQKDLGDRYYNSLHYLTAINPETISDLESPMITDQSEPESQDMNSELNSMLESLSHTINVENRHRNTSEVFIPPAEFKDSDVGAKISYLHALTQSLHTFISTGRFLQVHFSQFSQQTIKEIIEAPKPRVRKDVVTKLVNCNEGVYLNQQDLKQLSALLIGSCRDSSKSAVKELASVNKTKLENKKNEYKNLSEELDKLAITQEKKIFESTKLKKEVKKFKHQIGNLEKQLDVSRGECEDLATQCSALREKLIKKRKKMQDIISKEGNNIDLRISVSKLDLKIPMKLSIGLRN